MAHTISSNSGSLSLGSGNASYNPLTVLAGVTLSGGANYAIKAGNNQAWTITNLGTLLGGSAVYLTGADTLTNSGSASHIVGTVNGVSATATGAVINNQGTITGGSRFGLYLVAGGTVTNSTTAASISGAYAGIYAKNSAASVTNFGSIISTAAGVPANQSIAMYLREGGTVVNRGTASVIAGRDIGVMIGSAARATVTDFGTLSGNEESVLFNNALGGNVLHLYPGAVLTGLAAAGAGANTLALGSGVSSGSISLATSQITGFPVLEVDPNARWLATGSNTIGANAAITVSAGATLTLTGSHVFTQGLTLAGGGTLALTGEIEVGTAGTASAGQFVVDAGNTVISAGSVSLGDVINRGTINGTLAIGVYLGSGGTVTNSSAARIFGATYGIKAAFGASVSNQGTITGAANAGVALGGGGSLTNSALISGKYGVTSNGTPTVLINQGSIVGTISDGIVLAIGGTVTNSGTAALISGASGGIVGELTQVTINNQGSVIGATQVGVELTGGGAVTNSGTGALISGGTYGVFGSGSADTIVNQGKIIGTAAEAVVIEAGGTITNSGTGALLSGGKYGVLGAGTLVTVFNQGSIAGGSADGVALIAGGAVTNSGTGALISGGKYGVFGSTTGAVTVFNQGSIFSAASDAVLLQGGGAVTNSGTGALISAAAIGIITQVDPATVDNQGTIAGGSFVGIYFTAGGTLTNESGGLILGGDGGILATGAPATVTNQGTVNGGSIVGVEMTGGGTLTNAAGARIFSAEDGVYNNGTPIAVTNFGTIAGTSTAGLYLKDGGTVLNGSTTASIFGGMVGIKATTIATGVINDGTIIGGTIAGVTLNAGGSVTNSGTAAFISGGSIGVDIAGAVGSIVNQGTIIGTANVGVRLVAGGTVTNSTTHALISGGIYGVAAGSNATIGNLGTITGTAGDAVYLTTGGFVTNSTGAVMTGGYDAVFDRAGTPTVTNQGTLTGISTDGVRLQAGGAVTNAGTGAVITGGVSGIYLGGGGPSTVSNAGTIIGFGTVAATATASDGVFLAWGGLVTNTGTAAQILGARFGVENGDESATVTNQGSIIASGVGVGATSSVAGVYLLQGGSVLNSGTAADIAGRDYGVLTGTLGAATVTDFGTISGTKYAVLLQGALGGNLLHLYPGAVINGTVRANGSGNTLALGSATSAGSFALGGTQFVGFSNIEVDPNAQWLVTGNNTATAGSVIDVSAGATLTLAGTHVVPQDLTLAGSGTLALTGNIEIGTAGTATAGQFVIDAGDTLINNGEVSLSDVINGGTVQASGNDGLYLGAGGTVTNSGTSALISGALNGVYAKNGAATVTNLGTILASERIGLFLLNGGAVTNTGTGALIQSGYTGVRIKGTTASTVSNQGSIIGSSAEGVYLQAGGAVTNSGTSSRISGGGDAIDIRGTVASSVTNAGSIAGGGDGVYLQAGGVVTNSTTSALISGSSGVLITGTIASTVANLGRIIGAQLRGVQLGAGGAVTNGATSALISGSVSGVYIKGTIASTVVNLGSITGGSGDGVYVQAGGAVTNSATSALISGGFYGVAINGTVTSSVTNLGTIINTTPAAFDAVRLGAGGAVTNNATSALISGGIDGVAINGTVLSTVTNLGSIIGASGDGVYLQAGGAVTNSATSALISGGFSGVFIKGTIASTVANLGSIIGTSGSGVYLAAGGVVTNSATSALISGGTYGVLGGALNTTNPTAAYTTTVTNQGTISGAAKDGVGLIGASLVQNLGTGALITSGLTGVYVGGTVAGTVINSGRIVGTGQSPFATTILSSGVDLLAGGQVTNSGSAVISGGYAGVFVKNAAATVTNQGSIAGTSGLGVYLEFGGAVTNSTTSALISGGLFGVRMLGTVAGTVANLGTIIGTSAGSAGVFLNAGGTVTNGASASITAGRDGIFIQGTTVTAVLLNQGSIAGAGQDGVAVAGGALVTNLGTAAVITGGVNGVLLGSAGDSATAISVGETLAGTVINTGTIIGFGTAAGASTQFSAGVLLLTGGYVTNGSAALISGPDFGVASFGTVAETVSNAGTIISTGGTIAGLGSEGLGVGLHAGGLVTNSGSAVIAGKRSGVAIGGTVASTVVNQGSIAGTANFGVYLGTGALTNSGTGAVIIGGMYGVQIAGIVNPGTTIATTASSVSIVVGAVTNSGTGAAIAGDYGVEINGTLAGTVTSHATILLVGTVTNSAGALIAGDVDGIRLGGTTTGTINNAGTIIGFGTAPVSATISGGIILSHGGLVENSTYALIAGGEYGVRMLGTIVSVGTTSANIAGTIINQGSIIGTTKAGVYLGGAGTITNSASALISGGAYGVVLDANALSVNGTVFYQIGLLNQGIIAASGTADAPGTPAIGVLLRNGGALTNSGTGAVISGGNIGVEIKNHTDSIFNQGTIAGLGTVPGFDQGIGIQLQNGGTVTNSGTAARISGSSYGIAITSGGATIIDQGTIAGGIYAVKFASASSNVLHLYPGAVIQGDVQGGGTSGNTLELGSSLSAGTISSLGYQFSDFQLVTLDPGANWVVTRDDLVDPGYVINFGSNTAAGSSTLTAAGAMTALGSLTLAGNGTLAVSGSGDVELGTLGIAGLGQLAVDTGETLVTDGTVSLGNVFNQGLITSGFAYGVYLGGGGTVTNSGVAASISGSFDGVSAYHAAASVTNHGTIIGSANAGVMLWAGGSVTNLGPDAVIAGGVCGVFVPHADPATVTNQGTIIGLDTAATLKPGTVGVGVELLGGGVVTNLAFRSDISAVDYGVLVKNAAATVTNFGDIIGTAIDGVYLKAGGTVINGGDILGGLYAVRFAPGFANRLVLDPGALFAGLVEGGNTFGAAVSSTLELAPGSRQGTVSLGGPFSTINDFANVTVDSGAEWSIAGTIIAGQMLTNSGVLGSGITLAAGNTLMNTAGGTIAQTVANVVVMQTMVSSGTTHINTGTFGYGVVGLGAATVVNAGSIYGVTDGISLAGAGAITNLGTVTDGRNGTAGIYLSGGGTLTNASAASIAGAHLGVAATNKAATVINQGTITSLLGPGVALLAGGTVLNSGTAAVISGLGFAVGATLAAITVINQGTITASSGPGVGLLSGGTVIDSGFISGPTSAVTLAAGFANRLVLDPGATFSGTVDGGNTLLATATSTIEFAPGASTGTLTGLGSSFINFGSIQFDAGADWFVSGNTTGFAGTITGFAPGDTIELTGFTETSEVFAGGILTLGQAVGPAATLAFGGSLLPSDFVVTNGANGTDITLTDDWHQDVSGDFDNPANWSGGVVPGANANAVIDWSTPVPTVLHDSGNDTLNSLLLQAADLEMAGGTLTAGDLTNASTMEWTGGSLVLNSGVGGTGTLANFFTLAITPDGQRLTTAGTGTAIVKNTGTVMVAGAAGEADLDAPLANTGTILVSQGTLALDAGGSSNGAGLQSSPSGTFLFNAPGGTSFVVTSGEYDVDNTTIAGGTLDVSAASSAFFVDSLQLAAGGTLRLGGGNATAQSGFVQGPSVWVGTTGTPFLTGSGLFVVFGGGALTGGIESGTGLTQLIGTSVIGGGTEVDGGRTIENDGWLNWSSGNIVLGSGDPTALTQTGTLSNIVNATFYITADADIENQGAGGSMLNNAGVAAVFAGGGVTDIDAAVNNAGDIQVQSGTLSLNGGGSSDGAHLYVGSNTVLQFGTQASGAAGNTFTITADQFTVLGVTAITGGTLDVAPASGATFVSQLDVSAGALLLGAQPNAQAQDGLAQTGGLVTGTTALTVYGGASLTGGVESGGGTTALTGTSVIGGAFEVDGGRNVQNNGWLNWSSGNITLGAGDPNAAIHSGTLTNIGGATFYITSDGTIAAGAAGVVDNAGVMAVFASAGVTDIDAVLDSTGAFQVQSGTLSLNGGGTITAGVDNMYVAPNALLQFGTQASGASGSFTFTGGAYVAANTAVQAGTVDLSGVAGISFKVSLSLSGGRLLLGGNYPSTEDFTQSGGTLSGSAIFYVSAPAQISGGLETGSGRTLLQAGGSLSGTDFFDGGRSVENQGALVLSAGTLVLGGGDPTVGSHAATLFNDAEAVLSIEGGSTITTAGSGSLINTGTLLVNGVQSTTISVAVGNYGTVDVSSGLLNLSQAVGGAGTFLLGANAAVNFASSVGSGSTLDFLYPAGTLETQALGSFGATILSFAAGDTIDAAGVRFIAGTTTAGFSGGTLTVANATQSAGFVLTGTFSPAAFQVASDGHGGTAVTYV